MRRAPGCYRLHNKTISSKAFNGENSISDDGIEQDLHQGQRLVVFSQVMTNTLGFTAIGVLIEDRATVNQVLQTAQFIKVHFLG